MTSVYVPNIIEVLQRNTARKVALAAPDGMPFQDRSGDLVIRKRTELNVRLVPRTGRHGVAEVQGWPPVLRSRPSKAGMLA